MASKQPQNLLEAAVPFDQCYSAGMRAHQLAGYFQNIPIKTKIIKSHGDDTRKALKKGIVVVESKNHTSCK